MNRQKNIDQPRLIAGAMSGTSADGVDVAIVAITGRGLDMSARLIHHEQIAYPANTRNLIFAAREDGVIKLDHLATMGREITLAYAQAIQQALEGARLKSDELSCVTAHGQTLFHRPPSTIQWFDPALLAAEVGCAVVSDFRRADCAAGGQGAPLVPFADYILFRDSEKNRLLLNIGGIANVTWLKAGGSINEVIAFDTGPGNCISDHLCRKYFPAGRGYDADGVLAASGTLHFPTTFAFARSKYVYHQPPKSTDGPEMIALFEQSKRDAHFSGSAEDEIATACGCCAYSIKMTIDVQQRSAGIQQPIELLVSGGGVNNPFLMKLLHEAMQNSGVKVVSMDPTLAQAREAIAFALLGAATLDGIPSNVPSVTGAKRPVVLGSITPKP